MQLGPLARLGSPARAAASRSTPTTARPIRSFSRRRPIAQGVHTTAIDPKTGTIWVVWSDRATGAASIQGFTYKP